MDVGEEVTGGGDQKLKKVSRGGPILQVGAPGELEERSLAR